jgi:hypothetical protein
MAKATNTPPAEPDIKAAIAEECDRALKKLGAGSGLVSQTRTPGRDELRNILRTHGAKSDLLKIVGSSKDMMDDRWVLNELRRWNTRDHLSEDTMVGRDEHEFNVTAVEPAAEQQIDGIAITLTDARGGRVRLHLSTGMAEQLRDRISSGLDKLQGP